jgi:hypothetical protein
MAFAFQEESNKNIFTYVTAFIIAVAVVGGVYMLFFSKTPLIDMVAPPEIESVAKLSKVSFGTSDLSSNAVFSSLKSQVSEAKAGPSGRANPFSPF